MLMTTTLYDLDFYSLAEFVAFVYPHAVESAVDEIALDRKSFPALCPYSTEQWLDVTFLPGEHA